MIRHTGSVQLCRERQLHTNIEELPVNSLDKNAKYAVPALDKALDVIELLSSQASSLSQTQIAQELDRNTSEIFRTLNALEARGYIRRTSSGQYRLTLKLFELSRAHSPFETLLRVAMPAMRELSEEVNESCHLSTMRAGEVVVLAQFESPSPIRLSIEVGSRHAPLSTTSGRIILASMSETERDQFLLDYTDFSSLPARRRKALLQRIDDIRERGYEISDGERFVGGLDVGILVGSPDSTVKAALILATLRSAASKADLDTLVDAVRRAGEHITQTAGLSTTGTS